MTMPKPPSNMTPEEIKAIEGRMHALMNDIQKVVDRHLVAGMEREHVISTLTTMAGATIGSWVEGKRQLDEFIGHAQWGIKFQAEQAFDMKIGGRA